MDADHDAYKNLQVGMYTCCCNGTYINSTVHIILHTTVPWVQTTYSTV